MIRDKARSVLLATLVVVGCGQMVEVVSSGTSGSGGARAASSDAASSSANGAGGEGLAFTVAATGSTGAGGDASVLPNPCGSLCGPAELCDLDHLGLDDDCNGEIDEGCPCQPGTAHACFKGDPSYHGTPGCFDGVELCTA